MGMTIDCISRQAVLDLPKRTMRNYFGEVTAEVVDVKDIINLPTVTPQEPQTFKWCTDCKEYDQEKHCCHRWSKVIRDTVEEMKQEPKTGYWIEHPHEWGDDWQYSDYECSICHNWAHFDTDFCPNCGAKMVEPYESEG